MASPIVAIVEGQFLSGSPSALYASPAGIYTQIVKLTCVNSDTATHQITVYLVPATGSASNANVTTLVQAVQPNQVFNSPNEYAHVLNPGDQIVGYADTAGKVNIRVSGLLAS